jgi:hypothetical protein
MRPKEIMLATTLEIIRSSLKADPSLNPADRTKILALLRNGPSAPKVESASFNTPKVLSRRRTAQTLERSLRFVDRLAQENILKKVRLPGRERAIGFAEADVQALIEGKAVGLK